MPADYDTNGIEQVCALWRQLACQLGLPGQVPLLAGCKMLISLKNSS